MKRIFIPGLVPQCDYFSAVTTFTNEIDICFNSLNESLILCMAGIGILLGIMKTDLTISQIVYLKHGNQIVKFDVLMMLSIPIAVHSGL